MNLNKLRRYLRTKDTVSSRDLLQIIDCLDQSYEILEDLEGMSTSNFGLSDDEINEAIDLIGDKDVVLFTDALKVYNMDHTMETIMQKHSWSFMTEIIRQTSEKLYQQGIKPKGSTKKDG